VIEQDPRHKILSFYSHLKNDFFDYEKRVKEIYRVVIGPDQLPPEVKAKLRKEKRPADSNNLLLPILLFLTGTQRQSRTSLRCVPIGDGDEKKAQVFTELLFWNFNKGFFEYNFSKVAMDAFLAGIGWGHSRFNFVKGFWEYTALDPLRIRFDRQTTREGIASCRFLQDTLFMTSTGVQGLCNDIETLKEIKYRFRHLEPRMI